MSILSTDDMDDADDEDWSAEEKADVASGYSGVVKEHPAKYVSHKNQYKRFRDTNHVSDDYEEPETSYSVKMVLHENNLDLDLALCEDGKEHKVVHGANNRVYIVADKDEEHLWVSERSNPQRYIRPIAHEFLIWQKPGMFLAKLVDGRFEVRIKRKETWSQYIFNKREGAEMCYALADMGPMKSHKDLGFVRTQKHVR